MKWNDRRFAMKIDDVELDSLVMVTVGKQLKRGIVTGRRIAGRTEGWVDETSYPGMDVVRVAIEHIGVPPETIAITCLPDEVEIAVALTKVEVGKDYLMQNGQAVQVTREWTAEDGHTRIQYVAVEGPSKELLDCSKQQFLAAAIWKVTS
jgi:hypothetical protein